jgi:hypothetical protein
MTTVLPFAKPVAPVRLQCSACGAQTDAPCSCGAEYKPVADRLAEYDKANPGRSTRRAARDLGTSQTAVQKARRRSGEHGCSPHSVPKVTGDDGKPYPSKRKPPPDVAELNARAERSGWALNGRGGGKYSLERPDNNPDLCPGAYWSYSIPVTLREAGAMLDKIERSANPAEYTTPKEGLIPAPETPSTESDDKPAEKEKQRPPRGGWTANYAYQVWSDLRSAEREKLVEAIGIENLIDAAPASWRKSPKYAAVLAALADLAKDGAE